ncbi:transposase [Paraburkholderia sp. BL23I1N1]|uniref:transposase n=1 Tax=Paraburkholderia sp. BL23I1N1 TaxID=1938802 RepID=UPI000E74B2D4|nr:transposase [Paraburkholderia sp. BL23I1N1]RKE40147.1 transposase [Paraburkholderia sp. BL23I1N1]
MFNERGQVHMSEQEEGLQGRLVVGSKRDGRRKYDESAKRELILECLKPGVSIARTAMDHGINPNLVRTWISQYQREQGRVGVAGLASEPGRHAQTEIAAVAPSDELAFVRLETPLLPPAPVKPAATFMLSVVLPNGVRFEVGHAAVEELERIVQMLGRLPCSGSTKG